MCGKNVAVRHGFLLTVVNPGNSIQRSIFAFHSAINSIQTK